MEHREFDIMSFIYLIREWVPNAEEVFTKGNCIGLALILLDRFPGGDVMYDENHAVYRLNGKGYDINGYTVINPKAKRLQDYDLLRLSDLLKPKYKP